LFLFIARCFISGAFQAAYVYTPEYYPTVMRAIGLGTCSGMARIGRDLIFIFLLFTRVKRATRYIYEIKKTLS